MHCQRGRAELRAPGRLHEGEGKGAAEEVRCPPLTCAPAVQAIAWCVEHGVAKSDAHAQELFDKYSKRSAKPKRK